MPLLDKETLRRLGAGQSLAAICDSLGISRQAFDEKWQETIRSRVPSNSGKYSAAVKSGVQILRDAKGIPHIFADSDEDLFFGYGYAMAQDRLFQLDYLRRKGLGLLAEILGPDGLKSDIVARTVGLNRIAAAEWQTLPPYTQTVLQSFSAGINAFIETCESLPIEFDLLDYRPEPWTPIDSLAIESEFRWYLTGRFPVIVIPELARRTLGEGAIYEEYILGEADEESILWPGEYEPRSAGSGPLPKDAVGQVMGGPDDGIGSNNWVLSGRRTTTGRPLVASDPHIAFEAVSCWYEAHLAGGSFNVVGMSYVGMPAIMFGRNERVAWGITNNICSLRDLYQERTSSEHANCFEYSGRWEPARAVTEDIKVRGGETVTQAVSSSRNGPVVNHILPPPADKHDPVTLKWLGAYHGGWLTALLAMNRAKNGTEFREALRPWHVPTFSLVFADIEGHIGFQSSGRIPLRKAANRGYRKGWDPEDQWQGLVPFEAMPGTIDPQRGWVATANNRLAPNDYPYPLFGCWSGGHRAARIRQMIESQDRHAPDDMGRMHQDARSLRAAELVPALVTILAETNDSQVRPAAAILNAWDFDVTPSSVAATIFNVFFTRWCTACAQERFDAASLELMAFGIQAYAGRLLKEDTAGWFKDGNRAEKIVATFRATLDQLATRLGPNMEEWQWGRLHKMPLKHVLSSRGDLGQLLDHGGAGVRGDMGTVCNTGSGPDWTATSGAGYRLIADLSSSPPVLLAVDGQGQSGNPGSPHFSDQFDDWNAGRYHTLPLDREAVLAATSETLVLVPRGDQ